MSERETETEATRRGGVRVVLRDVGILQLIVAGFMLVPFLVSVLYREWYSALSLLAAAGITAAVGGVLYRFNRDARNPERYQTMLIAATGWILIALFGALPFFFAAHVTPASVARGYLPPGATYQSSLFHFRSFLNAVFESMSGYTTTGLTMTTHEPSIGQGLLFYRSFTQWVGGVGIIVFSIAVIQHRGEETGYALYQSEAREEKVRPTAIGTARAIWKVYIGLTALVAVYLTGAVWLFSPRLVSQSVVFDAVNHAMTAVSTGGFSTLDGSVGEYRSSLLRLAHVPPMLLGMISLPLYYEYAQQRDPRVFVRDSEFRTTVVLLCVGIPALAALLVAGTAGALSFSGGVAHSVESVLSSRVVRTAVFQYVSALSTTGWQTTTVSQWGPAPVVFLVAAGMSLGGAAGATVGGIKLIRVYRIGQGIRSKVARLFLSAEKVEDLDVGERTVPFEPIDAEAEVRNAALFAILYVVLLVVSLLIVLVAVRPGFTFTDVLFEVASAQGTVGLYTGISAPTMSPVVEVLFILLMWAGRLEILPVLVLVRCLFTDS